MQEPRVPREDRRPEHWGAARHNGDEEPPPLWRRWVFPIGITVVAGIWVLALDAIFPEVLELNRSRTVATATTFDNARSSARSIPGRWNVSVSVDPMTDRRGVVATLPAKGNPAITLIAQCVGGTTALLINWRTYLGNDSRSRFASKHVTTRLGKEPPVTRSWEVYDDDIKTYTLLGKWILQSMLEHDRFVAKVTPYRSAPLTAEFDLTGIAEAITPVAEACNWLLDATDMPVTVQYQGSNATLTYSTFDLTIDPATGESTMAEITVHYRLGPGTKGARLIEACRGRSAENGCYVRIRHRGTEVTELLSAKAN